MVPAVTFCIHNFTVIGCRTTSGHSRARFPLFAAIPHQSTFDLAWPLSVSCNDIIAKSETLFRFLYIVLWLVTNLTKQQRCDESGSIAITDEAVDTAAVNTECTAIL